MSRRALIRLAVVSALVSAAAAGAWSWWQAGHDFDSARWKAHRGVACNEGDYARDEMVGDLRANDLARGMTMPQVRGLLGGPEKVSRAKGGAVTWTWATAPGFTRCWYLAVVFVHGRLTTTDHYS